MATLPIGTVPGSRERDDDADPCDDLHGEINDDEGGAPSIRGWDWRQVASSYLVEGHDF